MIWKISYCGFCPAAWAGPGPGPESLARPGIHLKFVRPVTRAGPRRASLAAALRRLNVAAGPAGAAGPRFKASLSYSVVTF